MRYAIEHGPAFATLDLFLDEGESIHAEPDAMLSMSSGIEISAKIAGNADGGLLRGVKSMIAGERFFSAIFTAQDDAQELTLAPAAVGEIVALELGETGDSIAGGAYLASAPEVRVELVYGGIKGWLAKKGFFLVHVSGAGLVFLAGHGAIRRRRLAADETFIIDNSFLVAFEDTVTYELVTAGQNLRATVMSGEGLINRYTGPGELIYQTRGAGRGASALSAVVNAVT